MTSRPNTGAAPCPLDGNKSWKETQSAGSVKCQMRTPKGRHEKNKTSNTAAAPTDLGHSPDALAQRKAELLALLAQTAPELISDNQLNLDKLKDLLEPDRIADPLEHYELSWAGKTAARREIQKTTNYDRF